MHLEASAQGKMSLTDQHLRRVDIFAVAFLDQRVRMQVRYSAVETPFFGIIAFKSRPQVIIERTQPLTGTAEIALIHPLIRSEVLFPLRFGFQIRDSPPATGHQISQTARQGPINSMYIFSHTHS